MVVYYVMFIVRPPACIKDKFAYQYLNMFSEISWEYRFLTLVGFPLGFGLIVRSFPFVRYVMGEHRNFVLILVSWDSHISCNGQGGVTWNTIPFQRVLN